MTEDQIENQLNRALDILEKEIDEGKASISAAHFRLVEIAQLRSKRSWTIENLFFAEQMARKIVSQTWWLKRKR